MARDRQRAKQRRRRQAGGSAAGGATRARSTRAREIGLDDARVEDAGLGATPAPDPLQGALPDVTEAKLAEAGATPPDVGEELPDESRHAPDTPEHAPDALEELPDEREHAPDALAEPGAVAAPAAGERPRARGNIFARAIAFLGASWAELRRVQWPDRRQVAQGTAVVLGFVVIAGSYLGLLDAIWKPLIQAIL
jgi:preprotein translocase SecE subunit